MIRKLLLNIYHLSYSKPNHNPKNQSLGLRHSSVFKSRNPESRGSDINKKLRGGRDLFGGRHDRGKRTAQLDRLSKDQD